MSRHSLLRPYQQLAVKNFRDNLSYALFWEMQTGKSPPIIYYIDELFVNALEKGIDFKILILAPPSAIPGWFDHIATWGPHLISDFYAGNKAVFHHWNEAPRGLYLVSYSLIGKSRKGKTASSGRGRYISSTEVSSVDVIILDESHYIKNPDAGRTKFALELGPRAKYRFCLTGTPIGGKEMDYYNQVRFLNLDILDGMSRREFQFGFFDEYTGDFIESRRHILEERLAMISSTVRLKDIREDLPKVVQTPIFVSATPVQKKLVEKIEQELRITLASSDQRVTAKTVTAQMIKVQQLLNGHCKTDIGITADVPSGSPKLEWLREHLGVIAGENKTLIWINFIRDREHVLNLLDELRIGYVNFKSGLSVTAREKKLDQFRKYEEFRVFVAHPDSAGMGVNLSVAPVSIWYGRNFNWLSHKQASARNVNFLTGETVRYDLVVKDSLDEVIYYSLRSKGANVARNLENLVKRDWLGLTKTKI